MKRTWSYFSNTFEISTRKAFNKMLKIANDHDSRLNGDIADAVILVLWTFFNPLLLVYHKLYSAWQSSMSFRMSKTLKLTDTFNLLAKPWIREWQNKVYAVFPEDSPQDKALFPNNRSPFQSYSYEERIIAVNTLATGMAAYPELATLKTDVEAKYIMLTKVRDEQKQAMQNEAKCVDDLEAQRIVVAQALYKNLAGIMDKYYQNPTNGERFFDLALLRRSGTDTDAIFSQSGVVNVETSSVINLPKKFELSINANFIFANSNGGSELHFYFAATSNAADSQHKAVVLPGETLEITAGEMGWSTLHTMLIVKNVGELTAEYELTALEAVG